MYVTDQLCCFFFNDTATTEIYTLSLHDALPIYDQALVGDKTIIFRLIDADMYWHMQKGDENYVVHRGIALDRKSTRLNSSHANISYAVFCLKKNKTRSGSRSSNSPVSLSPSCSW